MPKNIAGKYARRDLRLFLIAKRVKDDSTWRYTEHEPLFKEGKADKIVQELNMGNHAHEYKYFEYVAREVRL